MSSEPRGSDTHASATRNAREESGGALMITPIGVSSLEDTTCPVCRETYSDPPAVGLNLEPEPESEWAVSVDYAAEWFGLKKCCGHVVGRCCLEKHLRTRGAWKNKCPICRDIWYHEVAPEKTQVNEQLAAQAHLRPRTANEPRRSQRIAARLPEAQGPSTPSMSDRSGISRKRYSQRPQTRPPRFMRQLLAALGVEDVSDGVRGTKEEVQRRLERMYSELP
jgi:hypothetical protein